MDFSHVEESHREPFWDMLCEFTTIWDGFLGEIGITEHRVELLPNTRLISRHPHRVGPTAWEDEKSQVENMLRAGDIEPA